MTGSSPFQGSNLTAPQAAELEVVLLGPGYGESILVHVGDAKWIVVDSCANASTGNRPAALHYLEWIGASPRDVELIVATHWHDDHVRGLGALVDACTNAKVAISVALRRDEFLQVVAAYSSADFGCFSSGVQELSQVLTTLRTRRTTPIFSVANRTLWTFTTVLGQVTLTSLSPSDRQVHASQLQLAKLLPRKFALTRRVAAPRTNDTSVATWLEAGGQKILLGSDLEETGHAEEGWSAIVSSAARPAGTADLFKVAHHGSETGHCEDVWKKMLVPDVISVLTPFRLGGVDLPTNEDQRRIVGLSKDAYTTVVRTKNVKIRRRKEVEKTVGESTRTMRVEDQSFGWIRMRRIHALPGWSVTYGPPSGRLSA